VHAQNFVIIFRRHDLGHALPGLHGARPAAGGERRQRPGNDAPGFGHARVRELRRHVEGHAVSQQGRDRGHSAVGLDLDPLAPGQQPGHEQCQLQLLQERLAEYPGTVLLVSHDRDFLDRVVTSVIAAERDGRWVEYAGGYTDMLKQRGADLKREAVKAGAEEKKESKGAAPSTASKRKLNFKDKHALETLPKTMAKLQAEIAKQQRHLDDPNLYQKNRNKFDTASDALTKAQKELEEAEDKWLELEVLREEIEQA